MNEGLTIPQITSAIGYHMKGDITKYVVMRVQVHPRYVANLRLIHVSESFIKIKLEITY